jgi:hypothetical protein
VDIAGETGTVASNRTKHSDACYCLSACPQSDPFKCSKESGVEFSSAEIELVRTHWSLCCQSASAFPVLSASVYGHSFSFYDDNFKRYCSWLGTKALHRICPMSSPAPTTATRAPSPVKTPSPTSTPTLLTITPTPGLTSAPTTAATQSARACELSCCEQALTKFKYPVCSKLCQPMRTKAGVLKLDGGSKFCKVRCSSNRKYN